MPNFTVLDDLEYLNVKKNSSQHNHGRPGGGEENSQTIQNAVRNLFLANTLLEE